MSGRRASWRGRRALALVLALGAGPLAPQAAAQAIDCPAAAPASLWLERWQAVLELDGADGLPAELRAAGRQAGAGLVPALAALAERCRTAAGDGRLDGAERQALRAALVERLLPERAAALPAFERALTLAPRALWRRLWYGDPDRPLDEATRWAVIVASPADEAKGWAALRAHQRRWPDVQFELHRPYFPGRPLALVVGRRLTRADAGKLVAYARELGMAKDAFAWPLPLAGSSG
jgi:hypothetical protein